MHTPTSTPVETRVEKDAAETPHTPFDASKVVEALPTPSSISDGRSQAAQLLSDRIKCMQDEETVGSGSSRGNLFPSSPGIMNHDVSGADDESRIADFSGDEKSCSTIEQQLRNEKNEAQATTALLQAELLAARGRHEEEKREWMSSMNEVRIICDTTCEMHTNAKIVCLQLKRRNEELEGRLSLYTLEGTKKNSLRSASAPRVARGEAIENDSAGLGRFRAFAQRFGSPAIREPKQQQNQQPTAPPKPRPDEVSIPTTIATNDLETSDLNINALKADISLNDSEQQLFRIENVTALEQKLSQSEHRAKILEQRLQIVKESGDAVIRSLNEELSDVAEDRARSESAMIKELASLDSQRRKEKEEYEKRINDWITLDERRSLEIREYERRIQSLLEVVKRMDENRGDDCFSSALVPVSSASFDAEAVDEMYKDLIEYLEMLSQRRTLVRSVNEALDMEFNASPTVADDMIDYYKSRPELKEFTLKSELPRMDYEILVIDEESGEDKKLLSTDEIRAYFSSLEEEEGDLDEEIEIILRAANQSLLADPLSLLTGEGEGKLVHFGSFHSTLIATVCSFQLDLRREGERRVKVNCELAVCVPSGLDGVGRAPEKSQENDNKSDEGEGDQAEQSATLELAR